MPDGPRGRRRLTGRLTVGLPPTEAFQLFTARGEQAWAEGWMPRFPVPGADDTVAGTVFQTAGHGQTITWIVVDSDPGRAIRYAQVASGLKAALITVTLAEHPPGSSEVTVVYDLTSLSPAGDHHLDDFATEYPAFLREWQDAIGSCTAP